MMMIHYYFLSFSRLFHITPFSLGYITVYHYSGITSFFSSTFFDYTLRHAAFSYYYCHYFSCFATPCRLQRFSFAIAAFDYFFHFFSLLFIFFSLIFSFFFFRYIAIFSSFSLFTCCRYADARYRLAILMAAASSSPLSIC